jgi:hypothetical protein
MKIPCANCPFRVVGGIPLMPARVHEIGSMMLDSQGGTFSCHKTVDDSDREEGDEGTARISRPGEVHCAGALIFAEKNGASTQMMRIMERFGDYDHTVFTEPVKALIWDDMGQWLAAMTPKRQTRKGGGTP